MEKVWSMNAQGSVQWGKVSPTLENILHVVIKIDQSQMFDSKINFKGKMATVLKKLSNTLEFLSLTRVATCTSKNADLLQIPSHWSSDRM